MKVLHDGRVNCRVRITGTYQGKPWVYEDPEGKAGSQYIWPDGNCSDWWWSEGNMACDCNREMFLPPEWDRPDGCGGSIHIDKIECLDYDGPTLHLNETDPEESP